MFCYFERKSTFKPNNQNSPTSVKLYQTVYIFITDHNLIIDEPLSGCVCSLTISLPPLLTYYIYSIKVKQTVHCIHVVNTKSKYWVHNCSICFGIRLHLKWLCCHCKKYWLQLLTASRIWEYVTKKKLILRVWCNQLSICECVFNWFTSGYITVILSNNCQCRTVYDIWNDFNIKITYSRPPLISDMKLQKGLI